MNCPLCLDQTLEIMHRNGVELDVCPKCRGIWLDRGEIDRLAADADSSPRRFESDRDEGRGRDRDRGQKSEKRKSKKKRKKSLADRLGDALEDVLDL